MLLRKAQIALKLEAAEGTAETLAAADADLYVYEPTFSPDIQTTPRNPLRATLSNLPHFIGRKMASISFKTELVGSAAAGTAPTYGDALKACGMSETLVTSTSVTYAPDSTTSEGTGTSATVALYIDGKKYMIYGARGDWELNLVAGEPGFITFTFTGIYGGVTDVALLTSISYPATTPSVFMGATLTNGGVSMIAENFSLKAGNTVTVRPDVTTATGFRAAAITARDPGGSVDPEEELVSVRDDWGQLAAGSVTALSLVHGTGAGNILTIAAAKLSVESVGLGDRDGILTNGIDFTLVSTTAAGEDEYTLAFT